MIVITEMCLLQNRGNRLREFATFDDARLDPSEFAAVPGGLLLGFANGTLSARDCARVLAAKTHARVLRFLVAMGRETSVGHDLLSDLAFAGDVLFGRHHQTGFASVLVRLVLALAVAQILRGNVLFVVVDVRTTSLVLGLHGRALRARQSARDAAFVLVSSFLRDGEKVRRLERNSK